MTDTVSIWLAAGFGVCVLLLLLHKPLGRLLRLGGRSVAALAVLAGLGRLAPASLLLPGANLLNALVVGVLGLPGLLLLLLLQWTFRI